jgi:hypothetical protein
MAKLTNRSHLLITNIKAHLERDMKFTFVTGENYIRPEKRIQVSEVVYYLPLFVDLLLMLIHTCSLYGDLYCPRISWRIPITALCS